LADNGGPTLTHALLSDSPLIDLGSADCPETDQRGLTRPADGNRDGTANCDSGAFEFRANLLLNSSFELDSDGNDKPDNWSEGRRFTPTREIQPVEGEFVGRFRATDNTDETILQKMKVSGGTEYLFSCWANIPTNGDSFTFRFQVRWLDAGDASISTNTIKTYRDDTKGKWDQATGNQFAPSGAVTAQIRMVASSLNGTIYVDNCEFRPA
jgi:hypothetical protein